MLPVGAITHTPPTEYVPAAQLAAEVGCMVGLAAITHDIIASIATNKAKRRDILVEARENEGNNRVYMPDSDRYSNEQTLQLAHKR
jgi:hypothetical protein